MKVNFPLISYIKVCIVYFQKSKFFKKCHAERVNYFSNTGPQKWIRIRYHQEMGVTFPLNNQAFESLSYGLTVWDAILNLSLSLETLRKFPNYEIKSIRHNSQVTL